MQEDIQGAFVRHEIVAAQRPPNRLGPLSQAREHLFKDPWNAALTVFSALLVVVIVWPAVQFLILDAVWDGASRTDCLPENNGGVSGACWPFIASRFGQFIYGFYPDAERWRVDIVLLLGVALLIPLLIPQSPLKRINALLFFVIYPVISFFMLVGGVFGLTHVPTNLWGGLLVTLVITYTGIIASLPLAVLLALGRRSEMPIIKSASVVFIEFWRGVPLITVMFFATYMLPLFLPPGLHFDALLRVLVGVTLFSAAYLAEVVRGGLQAIGRGQYEAAAALGLGYWRTMGFVVLPQALKIVIPGMVNSFIALFKDTTLVLIVSIFDLLGQVRAAFADPNWATPVTLFTGFAFAGLIYFSISFAMSRYALYKERRLSTSG